ncbi:MAG: ABC transporter ATP-binding protein, partial [Chloroflexi bacterium]|nr:ABC transporter ATP-binding protein [Chloroflexota bacterium]
FLIAPVVLSITLNLGRRMRKVSQRSQENLAEISHVLQETIAGQQIVQAFGMEEYEKKRFGHSTDQLVRTNLKAARISSLSSPLVEFIGYVSFVPFFLYANYQINRGFTIGAFVVFVAALFRLYEPVRKLSRMHLYFQQALASSHRIFELLDIEPEVADAPDAKEMPPVQGDIKFEGVYFHYVPGVDVLQDINFHAKPGENVALVGSTGAGKSTFVTLIHRFADVTKGRITIDGHDLRDVKRQSLVNQMSMVLQEPYLFSGTVRENIRYSHPEASEDDVVEAAKTVGAHDFIMALEQGYDTTLAERGVNLSVGQRQLVSFARAIVANPRILILDEATANIDTHTEVLIQEALKRVLKGRTSIVIAHRLSTIRNADKIVVLDHGQVAESGSHAELLAKKGVYAKLYAINYGLSQNGASVSEDGEVIPVPADND